MQKIYIGHISCKLKFINSLIHFQQWLGSGLYEKVWICAQMNAIVDQIGLPHLGLPIVQCLL